MLLSIGARGRGAARRTRARRAMSGVGARDARAPVHGSAGHHQALGAPLRRARARAAAATCRRSAPPSSSDRRLAARLGPRPRAQLNAPDDSRAQLPRRAAAGRRHPAARRWSARPSTASTTEKHLPTEFFESAEYRRIAELGTTLAGLLGAGAYVTTRRGARRTSAAFKRGHALAARPGAQGPVDPALQGPRRNEPRAALGHHDQSRRRAG